MKPLRLVLPSIALFGCLAAVESSRGDTFGSGDNTFDIEFVTIGNPGNPPDTTADPNPAGAVEEVYRMGKYEISRSLVQKANAEGNLQISLGDMDFALGGTRPSMPATDVSWNEAARFVNWLNASQGFSPAYKFSTQPGELGYDANANIEIWQPGDAGYDPNNLFRNSLAAYFLPNVHEWHKAAFYDPEANGGAGGYWDFPNGSNTKPMSVASGTGEGTAVYANAVELGPADVTEAGGESPYGVVGQAGNVWEWDETAFLLSNDDGSIARAWRGGDWFTPSANPRTLSSNVRGFDHSPTEASLATGFRVASIPEPRSFTLAALAILGLLMPRRR